ncbi:MAG: alpha/beta fold hydrolase [Sphaerochaetaceae bacterium]
MEPTIVPSFDGFFLSCFLYRPSAPIGIVQIIHGAAEVKSRYEQVAQYLQEAGYCVLVSDQRGHGDSVDAHFVRGYLPSVDVLVEDQYVITRFLKNLYPDLPFFLLGHSFGSIIGRLYLGSYDHELSGLVMTGTPCYVRGIGMAKAFVRFLMLVATPHGYGLISTKLTTSANLKWVCSDPEVVKERLHDPYRKNFKYQLQGIYTIFDALQRLHQWTRFHPANSKLPILSITGNDDPIPGGKRGLADTERSLKRIGYQHISCQVFEGMRHEVLMEKEKEVVFSLLKDFMRTGESRY